MKKSLFMFIVFIGLGLFSSNLYAGNPGKSAMNCISTSTNSSKYDNLVFKNRCSYQVFVVWCGDLKWSKKGCGDGPKNSYYTQSANIEAYGRKSTTLQRGGRYSYAACKGKIGFGTKGIKHPARSNGRFTCTRTGRY